MIFRSLRRSIFLLGAIGVTAAMSVALQGYWAQGRMDQRATEVFVSKDVVADILPPPMYLIELRLVLSQAVEGTLAPADAQKEVQRLTGEYESRVRHWQTNPPYGLERLLLGQQHDAAERFVVAARTEVIDRLLAGDPDGARQRLPAVNSLY